MTALVESLLTQMRDLARENRTGEAVPLIDARLPAAAGEEAQVLQSCRVLAQWHAAATAGRFDEGLNEAFASLETLQQAGYEHLLAWALSAVGFSIGLAGNFESGLRWAERAVADLREQGDVEELGAALGNQASLLAMAGNFERAERAYLEGLGLGPGATPVIRSARLNNLAFCYVTWARSLEDGDAARGGLAAKALQCAIDAEAQMEGPAYARWRAWSLANQGSALYLLGRHAEAEAAFRAGRPLSLAYTRINVVLLAAYGRLLAETGRHDEARTMLDEAYGKAPASLLDSSLDLVMESRVRLEVLAGRTAEALQWSDRRNRRLERQYRERLYNSLRQADLLVRIEHEWLFEQERAQAAILESRLRERESLLRDLHDGFGSQLASARLAAQRGALNREALVELLDECIADLYLVVDTMTNAEGRVDDALRLLRNRLQNRLVGHPVELYWRLALDEAPGISHPRLVQVLRIVQEALSNALKHARATTVWIDASWREPDALVITVRDDGAGLPATLVEGHGLRSMKSRAAGQNATLSFSSAGGGTCVELTVPVAR